MPRPETDRAAAAATFVLAALALAPVLLARGYVLVGDMTFVPAQPAKAAWLGLDGSVPRAVPADALVSFFSVVVPGDLLQKAVLLGSLFGAALGMLRLVRILAPTTSRLAPLGAAVLYLWNPWVLDRLAIGHWGLLVGYAALPWVAAAALRLRTGTDGFVALLVPLALAAFGSPTGGIAAALLAVALVASRPRVRRTGLVVAAAVVVNLPWLLPGLLAGAEPADPGGVAAFAARSDGPLGAWGSLLTFGGIWKRSLAPGERGSWLLVTVALLITLVATGALLRAAREPGESGSVQRRLAAIGAVGLVLAALPVTGPGRDLAVRLVQDVPGAGILRDSQKWLLLMVLAVCVGFGLLLDRLGPVLGRAGLPTRSVLGALALAPVVLLPSLAWGIAGHLDPVGFPGEWRQVRTVLADQPDHDLRTVVLPWSAYQRLPWNGNRAALDPALRYFPGDVVTSDDLAVSDRVTVTGEDGTAARITRAIATGTLPAELTRLGVRYVLLEKTAAGADPAQAAGGTVLHDGPELRLVDLGKGGSAQRASYAPAVLGGDVLAFGLALVSVVIGLFRGIRRKAAKSGSIGSGSTYEQR